MSDERPFDSVGEEDIEAAPPTYSDSEGVEYTEDVAKDTSQQKRLSAYSFADLPEVVPPETFEGAQVIHDNAHKEVVPGDDPQVAVSKQLPEVYDEALKLPEAYDEDGGKEPSPIGARTGDVENLSPVGGPPKRKILGIPLRWFIAGLVLLALIIVALGAGLGVGLHHSSKARYEPPSGAFTGTKMSMGTQTWTLGGERDLVVYFQHETGTIRWMQLQDGTWIGGNSSTQAAIDAKPGTPISVVSYTWDGLDNWRVYYIDNTNTLKETWQATQTWTQGWELGLLPNLGLQAWDDPKAGMAACWYGTTTEGNFSEEHANATSSSDVLIRLFYAKDSTTFQELTWNANSQIWSMGQEIGNIDASSSPACYNRQLGSIDYLMLVDQHQSVNVFWKDSSNTTNTTAHPANQWTNSSISIPNAGTAATLAWTNYLFAQDTTTGKIKGYNITFDAENTTVDMESAFEVQGDPGISQTGLAVTIEGDQYVLMYQTNETSISTFDRDVDGTQWSAEGLYIPND